MLTFIIPCSCSPMGSYTFKNFCCYQCEALQMLEIRKALQLACKQVVYEFCQPYKLMTETMGPMEGTTWKAWV